MQNARPRSKRPEKKEDENDTTASPQFADLKESHLSVKGTLTLEGNTRRSYAFFV